MNYFSKYLLNSSINIIVLLWVSLFFWRKSFSYLKFGGIYIIEILVLISILLFLISFLIRKKIKLPSNNTSLYKIIIILLLFFSYSLLNSIIHFSINLKSLLPGVYPIYFVIVTIICYNIELTKLDLFAELMLKLLFLSSFISLIISPLGLFFLPETDNPGWTYIFGASLSACLILVKNKPLSIILFICTLLISIITFQRGVFLCFFISFPFLFLVEKKFFLNKFLNLFKILLLSLFILLLVSPFVFKFLNNFNDLRFDISFHNLYLFINSIFSTSAADELGVAGTRSHRLDMWVEVIKISSNNLIFIFGDGFQQDVGDKIGIQFRAVHNGFITIFYQNGIIGLGIFLYFLFTWSGDENC